MKKHNYVIKRNDFETKRKYNYFGIISVIVFITIIIMFFAPGCKAKSLNITAVQETTIINITETFPANLADSVATNPKIYVLFDSATNTSDLLTYTISLKQDSILTPGNVTYSGNMISFLPDAELNPNSEYYATLKTNQPMNSTGYQEKVYTWSFKTGIQHIFNEMPKVSVFPLNGATHVANDVMPVFTAIDGTDEATLKTMVFTLKNGTIKIEGSLEYFGNTITFNPAESLMPNTEYTGQVSSPISIINNDYYTLSESYLWSFTTARNLLDTANIVLDTTKPIVISVNPQENTSLIAVNSPIIANFSEIMNTFTMNSESFTLTQGNIVVPGNVAYSGSTATFIPTANLAGNTEYTATVTTAALDIAGNAMAINYSWIFKTVPATTIDITAPTVQSFYPANNAIAVPLNTKLTGSFSEAINSPADGTITFMLKQGTKVLLGKTEYFGISASFTPDASLASNTVYTATLTVKALNSDAQSSRIWNFTTVGPKETVKESVIIASTSNTTFAKDVIPILGQCMNCHKHKWVTAALPVDFYKNLVSAGYIAPADYAKGKMYIKMKKGHPTSKISDSDLDKVMDWLKNGSKNN